MLRIIIWADPDKKKEIFKRSIEDKSDNKKVLLEDKVVTLDPKYHSLSSFIHSFLVSNQYLIMPYLAGTFQARTTACTSITLPMSSKER